MNQAGIPEVIVESINAIHSGIIYRDYSNFFYYFFFIGSKA